MTTTPRSGEDEIVSFLRKKFGGKSPLLARGIGDDAAVILPKSPSEAWVLTTDFLSEEIDFRKEWYTPRQLGHKSLAVNLSDIAAMGASPRFYMVALALPSRPDPRWIEAFYSGLTRLGRKHGALLVGGDLSRSIRGVQVCISVLGVASAGKVVYRSGGRPGDDLYVTGELGKSASGLNLLGQSRLRGATRAQRSALSAHREPQPRCEVGLWLAEHGFPGAMIDISDGLSRDLPRLCEESGTGAEVDLNSVPVFRSSAQWGCDPLSCALHGGEDFELLFSVSKKRASRFMKSYPRQFPRVTRIGRLTREKGVFVKHHRGALKRPLELQGFDHFAD